MNISQKQFLHKKGSSMFKNKILGLLLFSSFVCSADSDTKLKDQRKSRRHKHSSFVESREAFHFAGGLVVAGLVNWAGQSLFEEQSAFNKIGNRFGVNAKDFGNVMKLASTFYALSTFAGNHRNVCRRYAWRAPIVACEAVVVTAPTTREFLSKIPLGIGEGLGFKCSNGKCTRVCKDCMMTQGLVLVATHMMLDPLITRGCDWAGKKLDYIYHDYMGFERSKYEDDDYDDYDDYK